MTTDPKTNEPALVEAVARRLMEQEEVAKPESWTRWEWGDVRGWHREMWLAKAERAIEAVHAAEAETANVG